MLRVLVTVLGSIVGVLALIFGLTIFAQGAQTELYGRIVAVGTLALGGAALYVAATGIWGAWSPVSSGARIRSIRGVLLWAIVVTAYMCWGLPLFNGPGMNAAEWLSFAILASMLAIAIYGIIAIRRRPRRIATLLSAAAAYAAFVLLRFIWLLLFGAADRFSGPAPALSFFLAATMALAYVLAFWLAWPLNRETLHREMPG